MIQRSKKEFTQTSNKNEAGTTEIGSPNIFVEMTENGTRIYYDDNDQRITTNPDEKSSIFMSREPIKNVEDDRAIYSVYSDYEGNKIYDFTNYDKQKNLLSAKNSKLIYVWNRSPPLKYSDDLEL